MTCQYLRAWVYVAALAFITGGGRSGHAQNARAGSETPRVGFALVSTPVKRIRGELKFHLMGPNIQADEWTVIVARLPELPGQVDVRSALTPAGATAREHSDAGRAVLYTRIPGGELNQQNQFEVLVEYEATLVARKLVELKPNEPPPTVAPLDARTRRVELAPGRNFDFTSRPFQDWLKEHELRREPEEGEMEFARRAFLAIKSNFQYERRPNMDRRASRVCRAGSSDCGGMSIVFVSALRANRIPARLLSGRWAVSSVPEGSRKKPDDQAHVKAEFFAQGVGWVPVDISAAVQRARSPESLRHFGNDAGDFVTFHVDGDLVVDTYFGRRTVEWLQDPSFWAIGGGSLDGLKTRVDWKVESEPLEIRPAPAERPKSKSNDRRRLKP